MRIPCAVVLHDSYRGSYPVFFTRTYWGAKRVKARIKKVDANLSISIYEIWNLPGVMTGRVR